MKETQSSLNCNRFLNSFTTEQAAAKTQAQQVKKSRLFCAQPTSERPVLPMAQHKLSIYYNCWIVRVVRDKLENLLEYHMPDVHALTKLLINWLVASYRHACRKKDNKLCQQMNWNFHSRSWPCWQLPVLFYWSTRYFGLSKRLEALVCDCY